MVNHIGQDNYQSSTTGHACKALILHCIDFRLGPEIKKYLERNRLLGDADIISIAGAVKDLAHPANKAEREFILKQIDISRRLHHINTIILMNHTDCGAYGGKAAFASEKAEREKHVSDMKKAARVISARLPGLKFKTALAKIHGNGNVEIEEIV